MRQNKRRWCVIVASVLVMFYSSGLSWAQDTDSVLRSKLALPDLIQEVLARNPELAAARKQWEAATNRIAQARSLDDPILSVQLWNVPQPFKATQADNTIFGFSQNLPFPGKLALKGDVASRSADMTEQAIRAKERELIARLKQAYYDLFLAQKTIQIHHEQVELLRQFVEIANAKFRAGKGSQADVLKAQVELSLLQQQLPVLEQRRKTAGAMLNTLLDRDSASPLGLAQDPHNCRSISHSTICVASRSTTGPRSKPPSWMCSGASSLARWLNVNTTQTSTWRFSASRTIRPMTDSAPMWR
jgi:cobalt-zinc-cadmium efflux system outer membrane protein